MPTNNNSYKTIVREEIAKNKIFALYIFYQNETKARRAETIIVKYSPSYVKPRRGETILTIDNQGFKDVFYLY